MQGAPVLYLGSLINTDHFRAFIYGADSQKKLVNSWDEFQKHMATGLWFSSADEVLSVVKPKRSSRKKADLILNDEEIPNEEGE